MDSLKMAAWIDTAKQYKRQAMDAYVWGGDMSPIVEACRDGKPLLRVMAPEVDRDQALVAVAMLASGMQADEAWLAVDAHMTTVDINPSTGQEWAPGEMQDACERGACQTGLITDALFLLCHRRGGEFEVASVPYHVHKANREIVWVERHMMMLPDGAVGSGVVPDALRRAFEAPYLVDVAIADGQLLATAREQASMEIARAIPLYLKLHGFVVL